MSIAYLSLGSNLGDRKNFIDRAVRLLADSGVVITNASSLIETSPVGGPPQGDYLNTVLKVKTDHRVEDLHVITSQIEHRLGRVRDIKNGPRTIDIDILIYDDVKLVTKSLIIPHPRMFDREFVMGPLKEIEPELCASYVI